MAGFRIAEADGPGDIAAVADLFRAYAASLGVDLGFQDFETELATLPGKYAPPDGALLVAYAADRVAVGCIGMRRIEADVCEMKRLYLSPEARGTGVGRALAMRLIEVARGRGYREMWLDSLPSMVRAIEMYRSLGFVPMVPYYDNPIPGAVFLRLRLDQGSAG